LLQQNSVAFKSIQSSVNDWLSCRLVLHKLSANSMPTDLEIN